MISLKKAQTKCSSWMKQKYKCKLFGTVKKKLYFCFSIVIFVPEQFDRFRFSFHRTTAFLKYAIKKRYNKLVDCCVEVLKISK